ncbi:MAG TPA: NHL repeat-containing protein [Chloroflexota bacterium]
MTARLIGLALIGLAALVSPLQVWAGGPAPVHPQPQPGTWKPIITVGAAGGLAIDRRGAPSSPKWAYVPNPHNRTLIKFGTGGSRLRSWRYAPPATYVSFVGVAVGGSGNVFVADGGTNRVVKFDPFGRQLAVFTGFKLPTSVAVDRAGNLYVAELNAFEVTKLSPAGQVLARWHIPWANGTGSGLPEAVAVDSRGTVYVGANCFQDECPPPHGIQQEVVKLNAGGVFQGSILGNNPYVPIGSGEQRFVTVNSVAVDAKDNLYVGSSAIRSSSGNFFSGILVYTPGLSLQTIYPLPGTSAPTGVAFDGSNALYAAYNGRVLTYVP